MAVIMGRAGRTSPMGATLTTDGVLFRTWAPHAVSVAVVAGPRLETAQSANDVLAGDLLEPLGDGTWGGFLEGLADGAPYLFYVTGAAGAGWKRDPYARELTASPPFPAALCIIRDPASYPWRADNWQPPAFSDLVIYQLHVGTWWAQDAGGNDVRQTRGGTFLDVADRLGHLQALGVNAIQLLPVQEFETSTSLGYNGSDLFSPEMSYCITPDELGWRLARINAAYARFGKPGLTAAQLGPGVNQLKALIDLSHLCGIAVVFDVVYNHAGGGGPVCGLDDRSLWFYDRQTNGNRNNSLYFTDQTWTGPVFAYWNDGVSQFLIDNARSLVEEYRIDGLRYDEISALSTFGGDVFAQRVTAAIRAANPAVIQIAEYWHADRGRPITPAPVGLGFDAEIGDQLRIALRTLVSQASAGRSAPLDLAAVATGLTTSPGESWRLAQCLENHDLTYAGHPDAARIPALADGADPKSWYARSRTRAVTALLMTAPGIPSLFMGEEILEAKRWSDDRDYDGLVEWSGLAAPDSAMRDFLRFTTDLIHLRRGWSALRSGAIRISRAENFERVLVMHRWIEGAGQDVIVAVNFDEFPKQAYAAGLPYAGRWRELFNSDVYDQFPNPAPVGNGGHVEASGGPLDGFAASASLTLPPNGVLVLARG